MQNSRSLKEAFDFFSLHVGFIVRWKIFDPPSREQMYDDNDYWEVSCRCSYLSEVKNHTHDPGAYAENIPARMPRSVARVYTFSRGKAINYNGSPCVN